MNDKTKEKTEFDKSFFKDGVKFIAGVDEVGRGPLAGPVVCCAVVREKERISRGRDKKEGGML